MTAKGSLQKVQRLPRPMLLPAAAFRKNRDCDRRKRKARVRQQWLCCLQVTAIPSGPVLCPDHCCSLRRTVRPPVSGSCPAFAHALI